MLKLPFAAGVALMLAASAVSLLGDERPTESVEKKSVAKVTVEYPPTVDISADAGRQTIIAQGTSTVYQGHPTTLLLPDGRTMFCTWTYGHGGGCGPLKRSDDAGRTWSELLPVPESWNTVKNCPSLYRLTDPSGVARLFVFAGQGPDGTMQASHSLDEGRSWTSMQSVGLKLSLIHI